MLHYQRIKSIQLPTSWPDKFVFHSLEEGIIKVPPESSRVNNELFTIPSLKSFGPSNIHLNYLSIITAMQ